MPRHQWLTSIMFLTVASMANWAKADLITIGFSDTNATDGSIDGNSELFQSSLVNLGDASFNFQIAVTTATSALAEAPSGDLGHDSAAGTSPEFDALGEDVTFNISIVNFTTGGTTLISNVGFSAETLTYDAAFGSDDSATISNINGMATSLTWADMNGGSDFTGHLSGVGVNLFQANGNQAVTSFTHDFVGGRFRIEDLTIEFSAIAAVPEPSTTTVLVLATCIGCLRRRRR